MALDKDNNSAKTSNGLNGKYSTNKKLAITIYGNIQKSSVGSKSYNLTRKLCS